MGGHHQAVCRLGPTPSWSLGAWGACPAQCPQVSTGRRAPDHKGHLPTARLWEPECRGKAHRPVSPQGQPTGDPNTPRVPAAVNSGLLTWRKPTGLVSSRLALGTPWHLFPKLTWTVPRDGGPRAEPTSFAWSVRELRPALGAEPTGWAMAGSPSWLTGSQDGQERACRFNAMAYHRGASGKGHQRWSGSGITGLRPALPTWPPRPVPAVCSTSVSHRPLPLLAPRTLTAPLSSPPCSGLLRAPGSGL